jgi:MoaA/NifB/PqqE/SkfB family radical SAM enzyme
MKQVTFKSQMCHLNPSILHFHITSMCPYSCRHCFSDSGAQSSSEELDVNAIHKMLDRAIHFGMQELELSGGEPLILGKDPILEIIRYASNLDLLTTLNTNMWFLDESYIQDLDDSGLDRLKSSLYGTSCRTHDDFTRRQGSFSKLSDALGFLREYEIEVWINYVVTPKNMDEASGLSGFLEPYAVDTIQLSSIIPSGRGRAAQEYIFSDDELSSVIEQLDALFPDARKHNVSFTISLYGFSGIYPFGDRYCDYLKDRLVVDPSGHVIPCCILPSSLSSRAGSIVHEDLGCILSSQRLKGKPIFYWLAKGHRAMHERLEFEEESNNLCSTCIKMLTTLCADPACE